jgi:hypothetical protein
MALCPTLDQMWTSQEAGHNHHTAPHLYEVAASYSACATARLALARPSLREATPTGRTLKAVSLYERPRRRPTRR